MSEHAEGTFVVDARDIKTYRGDLDGVGTPDPGGAERFQGTLHGRSGAFRLTHESGEEWRLGGGEAELTGISGLARLVVAPDGRHTYALDYDLTPPRRRMPWRRPGPAAGHRPV